MRSMVYTSRLLRMVSFSVNAVQHHTKLFKMQVAFCKARL